MKNSSLDLFPLSLSRGATTSHLGNSWKGCLPPEDEVSSIELITQVNVIALWAGNIPPTQFLSLVSSLPFAEYKKKKEKTRQDKHPI